MSDTKPKKLSDSIKEAEFANILGKLKAGKTLTARESQIVHERAAEKEADAKPLGSSLKDAVTTVDQLAELFGLTTVRIHQLAGEGVVIRTARGTYDFWQSVQNYIKFLQERKVNQWDDGSAGYSEARTRLTSAKATIAEIEADLKKGTTHDAAAVAAVWADMIGNARSKLLGLPAKLAGALDGLTIQEREALLKDGVNESLRELADYSPEVVTGEWERRRQPMEDEEGVESEDEPDTDE
jgi:phage terminase Nu1 subunit (DNA packaging protein)